MVDLLVAMCRAALESPRKSIIFEPYPSVVDPNDPKTLAFNPKVTTVAVVTHHFTGCLVIIICDNILKHYFGLIEWVADINPMFFSLSVLLTPVSVAPSCYLVTEEEL